MLASLYNGHDSHPVSPYVSFSPVFYLLHFPKKYVFKKYIFKNNLCLLLLLIGK